MRTMRRALVTAVLLVAACAPPPEEIQGGPSGCGITLDVRFDSPDDMVAGYPAVNDASRLRCNQLDSVTIQCAMIFDATGADCRAVQEAVEDRLDEEDIAGATAQCMDPCTGTPIPA